MVAFRFLFRPHDTKVLLGQLSRVGLFTGLERNTVGMVLTEHQLEVNQRQAQVEATFYKIIVKTLMFQSPRHRGTSSQLNDRRASSKELVRMVLVPDRQQIARHGWINSRQQYPLNPVWINSLPSVRGPDSFPLLNT